MDDIEFLREKMRREAQELVNDLDKVTSSKEHQDDIVVGIRFTALSITAGQYIKEVIESDQKETP